MSNRNEYLEMKKDKVIHALQSMLHSSLSQAMSKFDDSYKDIKVAEVLPIALSRFIYRELLIMSDIDKIPIEQLSDLFIALLRDVINNKVDMFMLKA